MSTEVGKSDWAWFKYIIHSKGAHPEGEEVPPKVLGLENI